VNDNKAIESAFPMIGGALPAFAESSADFRFAFAVAAFADVLRGGQDWSLSQIRTLAHDAAGEAPDRVELVGLIDKAIALKGRTAMR
jgi:hypothetical protein